MLTDLRFAARMLFRTPIVTLVAILSLALGIGANTAMFSVMDELLLRSARANKPGELVLLSASGPKRGSLSTGNAGGSEFVFSLPMFRDLESKQTVLAGLAGHRSTGANVAYRGQTFSAEILEVSGSYFPVLGLAASHGRLLTQEDDKNKGGHPVAVLSHSAWVKRFNSNPAILNDTIIVNGVAMTVVGIGPEKFEGITIGATPEAFVPVSMHALMQPRGGSMDRRDSYWFYLFGRLKPGMSMQQAQSGLSVLFNGIINTVDLPVQKGASENFLKRFKEQQLLLTTGEQGQSNIRKNARTPILLLLGITGFVLLIACANIANLLLARAAGRAREMSIRLSIGASRGQLIRQLLGESMMIALAGGILGLFVASWTTDLLVSFLPPSESMPLSSAIDLRTLAFAMAVAVFTGLLFGMFPAIHSTRQDLVSALKDQAGSVSPSSAASKFRKTLVISQIALSLMLLIAAGLFVRSLVNVSKAQLGIQTGNVVAFGLSPELSKYTPEQSRALFEKTEETLAGIPGVVAVGASSVQIIANNNWGSNVSVDGFSPGPDADTNSSFSEIGPGFFRVVGIPVLAGRDFTTADNLSGPKTAIVNEAFQRKYSAGSGIVGKRMQVGAGGKNDIEIVGLVKDAKYSDVKAEVPPVFYLPYRQDKDLGSMHFYVRSSIPVEQVMNSVRAKIAELDPNLPLEEMKTLDMQVRENIFLDRMISSLAAAFAGLATLLAAIGLYGVLAFTVAKRTREIGIRMAVGADNANVRNLILRDVVVLLAVGIAIAVPAALGLARFTESLLYQMKGNDPMVVVGATLVVALVSLLAGYFPARRAMRVDPLIALRYD